MADKKQDLAASLAASSAKPQLRRGGGMRLSTEGAADAETQNSEIASSQDSEIASSQNRKTAKTQDSEIASSQKRETAKTQGPKRINRGYMLREDLVKEFKLIAVREDRNMYEVMEQALQEYLERRRQA
jgi:hypothetical protein